VSIGEPTTIIAPGNYCLTDDITTSSGHAISIAADGVVLDLKGHSVICRGCPSSTTASGIHAFNRSDVTIRNGQIAGFYACVWHSNIAGYIPLQDDRTAAPTNIRVEDIRCRGNFFRGVRVEARSASIRNNAIVDTGGSTAYPNAYAFGIEAVGPATIEGNTIYNTYGVGTGEGVGISVTDWGIGTIVRNNRIANFTAAKGTGSASFGIWIGGTSNAVVDGNTVVNTKVAGICLGGPGVTGIVTNNLISVSSTAHGIWFSESTHGRYGNNTTYGAATKYRIETTNVTAAAPSY